jgi:hypothetical protein
MEIQALAGGISDGCAEQKTRDCYLAGVA